MFVENTDFDFIPINHDIKLRYDDDAMILPTSWQQKADDYWRQQQALNAKLFDAKIVILSTDANIANPIINVVAIDYRYLYAYRQHIRHDDFTLCSVGVIGIIQCHDGIIIGRRAAHSGLMPNMWEFIPAGGVDLTYLDDDNHINPKNNIYDEAAEELNITAQQIDRIKIVGILKYHHIDMIEIAYNLTVNLSFNEIQRYATLPEHQKIVLYDKIICHHDDMVPSLRCWR